MNTSAKENSKPDPAVQGAAGGEAAAQALVSKKEDTKAADGKAADGKAADGEAVPEKAKDSGTGIGGFFQDIWDKLKEFFSSFSEEGGIGKIIGGLLGLGGAWLAGNFFGGGIMSTILTIALAIPLMLAGSDSIGDWINGLLGHGETSRGGDSPQRSASRDVAPARTREELTTKMEIIRDELEAYNRVAERRIHAGQLKDVTLEQLKSAQAISRETLDAVASGIPQANNATEITRLDQVLNGLNRGLDDLLQRRPEIQVDIHTEFNTIRNGRSSGAAGASSSSTPFTPTLTFTNDQLLAMVNPTNGQPDNNLCNRLDIFVDPNDPTRRLQVRPVDDSVADRAGIITLDALLQKVGPSASGIVFGQAVNGMVSVQAAPMGTLPSASTTQGRR